MQWQQFLNNQILHLHPHNKKGEIMKEIKAKEGYYLTNKNKTKFYKAIKGVNVKEEDYVQITEEEALTLMKEIEEKSKLS